MFCSRNCARVLGFGLLLAGTGVFGALDTKSHGFSVTYSLVDSPFTNVTGPYTTSDFITGYFTIDIPGTTSLADYANLPEAERQAFVTDFSFSDGVQTITFADGPFSVAYLFEFSTDSSSNIDNNDYLIQIAPDGDNFIAPGAAGGVGNSEAISGASSNGFLAFVSGSDPGVWTVVPEPSAFLLLACAASIVIVPRGRGAM